jgi:hypothetical protein
MLKAPTSPHKSVDAVFKLCSEMDSPIPKFPALENSGSKDIRSSLIQQPPPRMILEYLGIADR